MNLWRANADTRGHSADLDRILQEAINCVYPPTIATRSNTETISTTMMPREAITKVIFNDPATIVFWSSGDKTVVKCCENDVYDPEKGLAMAICKYVFGNGNYFHRVFKDWLPEEKDYDEMGARLFATDVGESIRKALSSIFPKNKEDDHHAEQ